MSIKNRIGKLENSKGINKISVANELIRLKELQKSGKAPPPKTIADYEQMIKDCDNPKLIEMHEAYIRAVTP